MGFTSQMNNGIEFRKIPHRKRSWFNILPGESLYHPLLFRSNNIQPVKISDKRRIDGAVSLLNAWVIYVRDFEDYMYLVG